MAPPTPASTPTPAPRSAPSTPHHQLHVHHHPPKTIPKHRLRFPSPNIKFHGAPAPPPPIADHPVEVIGRIRDPPADLRKDKDRDWDKSSSAAVEISDDSRSVRVRTDVGYREFALDGVSMSENEDLEGFYRRFVSSRVEGVRLGAKCTIMMYGPTGSGKSHTMFGCPKQPGIVYRALRDILGQGDENDDEGEAIGAALFVQVAVLEIYNEEIYDLLSGASNGVGGPGLGLLKGNNNTPKVRLEFMGKKFKNASYISGNEAAKITREVAKVEKRRIVKSTLCNERSSRSHCIIILDVPSVGGKLMLVDMAGSENIEAAGQTGLEAKMQTAKINQGNIALKRVVESIANGDSHVPFRDSKLTMLLQDSFEDDKSKILMILCASPDPKETHKTISTLEYGAKAKCIVRVSLTHLPTFKDKVDSDESLILLRSRIVAMNEFIFKLQMENKLKEKERDEARKELLQKEAELAELRTKIQHIEGRKSEIKEEEINLKVDQRTKTLKSELTLMEERTLQQKQELDMLRQRLEEVELERCKVVEKALQDIDGGRLVKRLETYSGEQGMVKSMELDMGEIHDTNVVKEIKEDSCQSESYKKLFQLDPSLASIEEEANASMSRFPDKVCLSTVFEEDEEEEQEERESIEDEVDKEVVEEHTDRAGGTHGFNSLVDPGVRGNNNNNADCVFPSYLSCEVGSENNSTEITKDPASARKTRIQNIFRLCGNHRELAQQVKTSSPLQRGPQDENKQPSPLALRKVLGSNLGLQAEQPQATPKYMLVSDSILKESPVSALILPFASLELKEEQKSANKELKRSASSERYQDKKENESPKDMESDKYIDIYVKWEASKEFSGGLIRKLKVLKNSSLADLRKLIESNLEGDNKKFTFLLLGDPSGAPVSKEKEASSQVNKLPTCNNQMNGYLACLRPVKKPIQNPDHVPFGSLENTLSPGLTSQLSDVFSPKVDRLNTSYLTSF
ncbi:kinesin-like protein KIN-10A [Zingiber officinale]|uniref:Kinesin-like protein KIN-10A n=1 Tax=Zingiber officinale TaxID=94328 RepID=A0A8J5I5P6_ZINOF|nr:kinesin-like protein KIN-10A [Zingiber officinale]KAG6536233.1 hypothetical protein ZIOFF_001284 [Zingiber officinale]